MRELREFFREGLASKIEALELASRALVDQADDSAASIRRIAHSLRGSGGTYGFPQVSEVAGDVENAAVEQMPERVERLVALLRGVANGGQAEESVILLVEDDPGDLAIIRQALGTPRRKIITASTTEHVDRALAEEEIHLIVIDLVLPDIDGRNLLLKIRELPRTAAVPVFVISGMSSPRIKAECLALGAQQYIDKPIDPDILSAAVATTLQTAGTAAGKWSHDELTRLPNRAAFHAAFERAVSHRSRTGQKLSVGILDLDKFKAVNDRHGHAMGDEVLRRSAEVISGRLRDADTLARWGGEEFVALLPGTPEAGSVRALENALAVLRHESFTGREGETFGITFSAGVTEVQDGESVTDVLARADRFLYQAKAAGRQRVFSSSTQAGFAEKTILLVEDDPTIQQLISYRLQLANLGVLAFRSAEAAIDGIGERQVELGILDVEMPGMDGFTLLEKLRATPAHASMPIVMLTGRGSEDDVVRGFRLGADDYVVKPFSPPELEARILRLLKRG